MISNFKAWYLRLRPFELKNKGDIYARLGARFYKKWVPTSGEVITRLRGIDRLKITETGSRRKSLENHAKLTNVWEWRHLISAIFLYIWAVGAGFYIGIEHFYTSFLINIIVNIFPIIVQRYNRIRIFLLLDKI
jgi:hypothetical protein